MSEKQRLARRLSEELASISLQWSHVTSLKALLKLQKAWSDLRQKPEDPTLWRWYDGAQSELIRLADGRPLEVVLSPDTDRQALMDEIESLLDRIAAGS